MDLRFSPIQGIVEVMDQQHTEDRGAALGSALRRLSAARERRGPIGMLDPFEVVSVEQRRAIAEPPSSPRRRRIFNFSDRARNAIDSPH